MVGDFIWIAWVQNSQVILHLLGVDSAKCHFSPQDLSRDAWNRLRHVEGRAIFSHFRWKNMVFICFPPELCETQAEKLTLMDIAAHNCCSFLNIQLEYLNSVKPSLCIKFPSCHTQFLPLGHCFPCCWFPYPWSTQAFGYRVLAVVCIA